MSGFEGGTTFLITNCTRTDVEIEAISSRHLFLFVLSVSQPTQSVEKLSVELIRQRLNPRFDSILSPSPFDVNFE